MPESVCMGQLHLSKACWELLLSDDQPHSDYNGHWQRALCMVAVLQKFPIKPIEEIKKENAIKQIKMALRYVQNTGTCYPGLGWICQVQLGWGLGLSPGSWQTSLVGSMSRYSAQILICIIYRIHFTEHHPNWKSHSTVGQLISHIYIYI